MRRELYWIGVGIGKSYILFCFILYLLRTCSRLGAEHLRYVFERG